MPTGVVLDTSFLITLAGAKRPNHQAARSYWRYFVEQAVPIFLPTIVVAEFCSRQPIPPEILQACVPMPFNWDDALRTGELDFSRVDRGGVSRVALKDDFKIIAQAIVRDAAWIITDDASSLYKHAARLKRSGKSNVSPIKLDDGFNPSHLKAKAPTPLFDPSEDEDVPNS